MIWPFALAERAQWIAISWGSPDKATQSAMFCTICLGVGRCHATTSRPNLALSISPEIVSFLTDKIVSSNSPARSSGGGAGGGQVGIGGESELHPSSSSSTLGTFWMRTFWNTSARASISTFFSRTLGNFGLSGLGRMMVGMICFLATCGEKVTQSVLDTTGFGAGGGLHGSGVRLFWEPYNSKSSSKPDSTFEAAPLECVALSLPKLLTLSASLLDRVVDVGELGGDDQSIRLPVFSLCGLVCGLGNKPAINCECFSCGRDWANLGGGGRGGGFFFGWLHFWLVTLEPNIDEDQELALAGGGGAARVGTFISPENYQI